MRQLFLRRLLPLTSLATACVLGHFAPAHAGEPFPTRGERLASPARSVAAEDSAEALVLNPANLANMQGREARWTYLRCGDDIRRAACGHSADLATALPFGLATGLRLDFIQPPTAAGFPYNGTDYAWVTWGLGFSLSERFQVGGSVQRSYSANPYTDGLWGLTAGLSYRPSTRFAFAAVAHDFNGPSTQKFPPSGYPVLDRTGVLAMAFRPVGTRSFEVGLEAKYDAGADNVYPRATLGIDIPGVGRARGDLEMQNPANDARRGVVASAGLEIGFHRFSGGGGAMFGNGLGRQQSIAGFATASIGSVENLGVPRSERAVSFRFESTPGPRAHAHLLYKLWKLAENREVSAVTMIMKAEPSASLAHAEELADAFRYLRAHGKKVVCAWEDAGPKALYACASADRVVVNPSGGVRYAGLKTTHIYLAGLLSKLGIKAEFVRIGAHKGAPEQFMNERASDVAKADQIDLLAQYDAVYTENLVRYRKLSAENVRALGAKGPFTGREARDAGLVDGFAFDDEVERATQDAVGRKVTLEKYEDTVRPDARFGPEDRIAVLYVDGDIIDGRSRRIPLLEQRLVGSYTIAETAERLRNDSHVKAVVLRVESPGGSSMASDVMWREIKLLADKKPLVVSMGSVAASGGYYVASASKHIFALPLTVTGSIGIFYGKANTSELLSRIGVNVEVRKTNDNADADSMFRGFTEQERAEYQRKIGQFYDVFLSRISEGRGMKKEDIDAVGQGRVWTGQQAFERGLVDRMGGLRHALDEARSLAKLRRDVPIVEVPAQSSTILDKALEMAGAKNQAPISLSMLPPEARDAARALAPLAVYGGDTALARMEWVPLESMAWDNDDE